MIVGSGLIACAFAPINAQLENVCIYAAGVSNSSCVDAHEFLREQQRLADVLSKFRQVDAFVYFSTCSIYDADALSTPYVQHKLAIELMVHTHSRHMILRLPQIAGKTPNPHTLLNFLYARILRSESFNLWQKAKRNIIDIHDIVSITLQLLTNDVNRKITINVANPVNYSMGEIVSAMEVVVGKRAIFELIDRGTEYMIDTSVMLPALAKSGVEFGESYLNRILTKYYK